MCGTTLKTMKRVIDKLEVPGADGGVGLVRGRRVHNYNAVTDLVAERVEQTKGRISAKRLLPAAEAAGYGAVSAAFVCAVGGDCLRSLRTSVEDRPVRAVRSSTFSPRSARVRRHSAWRCWTLARVVS